MTGSAVQQISATPGDFVKWNGCRGSGWRPEGAHKKMSNLPKFFQEGNAADLHFWDIWLCSWVIWHSPWSVHAALWDPVHIQPFSASSAWCISKTCALIFTSAKKSVKVFIYCNIKCLVNCHIILCFQFSQTHIIHLSPARPSPAKLAECT